MHVLNIKPHQTQVCCLGLNLHFYLFLDRLYSYTSYDMMLNSLLNQCCTVLLEATLPPPCFTAGVRFFYKKQCLILKRLVFASVFTGKLCFFFLILFMNCKDFFLARLFMQVKLYCVFLIIETSNICRAFSQLYIDCLTSFCITLVHPGLLIVH